MIRLKQIFASYNGQNPEDPSIVQVVCHKAENERRYRNTKGDHQCPNAHVSGSIFPEKCLYDDGATNSSSRADEEGDNRPANGH